MKNLLKFIAAIAAIAGTIGGVIYFLDKVLGIKLFNKEDDFDDFDDFDEEFDDDDYEDDDDSDREYVTLDIENEEEDSAEEEENAQE